MRALALLTALAVCLSGAVAAQDAHENSNFEPDPLNDPDHCKTVWEGIGLPRYAKDDERDTTIVCHTKFVLSHNNAALGPDWVIERLTADMVNGSNTRPKNEQFKREKLVPRGAINDDYKNINRLFDRGHQAPSDDFNQNLEWMEESFVLSNAVPQVGTGFNQDIWVTLESHVRDIAHARGEIYVVTGPVYPMDDSKMTINAKDNLCHNEIVLEAPSPKAICGGKTPCDDGVIVPSAMFKLVFDPNMQRANVFLMPNINHRKVNGFTRSMEYVKKYQVTVEALEQATNLEFFHDLPPSRRRPIETQCAAVMQH